MRSDHPFSLLDRYKIHMIGSDPIIGDANSLAIFIPQGFGESGNGLLSSNHWGTGRGKMAGNFGERVPLGPCMGSLQRQQALAS